MAKEKDVTADDMLDIREPRVYEIGYILVPHIAEEEIDTKVDAVRKMVTDNGGLPISEGRPELTDLAYTMRVVIDNTWQSFDKGYFGWIKFDVSPEKIADIKALLDNNKELIRFLLVKTIREDVMARPRFNAKSKSETPSSEEETEKSQEPIDEETLDKQIDDLVVETNETEQETSEKSE